MDTKVKILTLFFLVISSSAFACAWTYNFCQTLNNCGTLVEVKVSEIHEWTENNDASVVYEVREFVSNPRNIDVELVTWTFNGHPYDAVGQTPRVRSKFLLILCDGYEEISSKNILFSPSLCSVNALKIEDEMVTLYNQESRQNESYRLNIFKKNIVDLCQFISLEEGGLIFHNNITQDEVKVGNTGTYTIGYQIFNASGILLQADFLSAESEVRLDLSDYASGMYFFRFSNGFESVTKKLVKV